MRSEPWGLYHPDTEHDACGIGFVAHIKGEKSRSIIEDALTILERQAHRGATGADPDSGDGAGILFQLPHRFFKRKGLELGFDMPRRRRYGVGQVFLPADPESRRACEQIVQDVVAEEGQTLIGWRDVPVDPSSLGGQARASQPVVRQVYVGRRRVVPSAFERTLFVIRKRIESRIEDAGIAPDRGFHICSMSAETIVYKGMFTPNQVAAFYPDLSEPDLVSAIAVVHSRFSTNTSPTWDRAQPLRYVAHNGEINTLQGNRNWMRARAALLRTARFRRPLTELQPIIAPGGSDSAQFDNLVELLHLGGRSLPGALMLMIPEAFQNDPAMDPARRAFYDYASAVLEPWDGPAAITFTDGIIVGATLDRNGLRPARYTITTDDRVILASETGTVDIPPELVARKGRLQPGRMLIVDTEQGRIRDDAEVKDELIHRYPYQRWLEKNDVRFQSLPPFAPPHPLVDDPLRRQQRAFGWSDEDVRTVLGPMARDAKEPTGSMGNDTPLAVLSDRSPPLFHYFKQLFAQVTNPPIDPLRERIVMSLRTSIGGGGNPFDDTPDHCHRIVLDTPVITNAELASLANVEHVGVFEPLTLPMHYDPDEGERALEEAVDLLCSAAIEAVDQGFNVLILSDRGVDAKRVPIPSLLATSAVHQALVREGTRLLTGLVIETAEAREVHHFATLLGYGAGAVNPWLALDTVRAFGAEAAGTDAVFRYIEAVGKGLLKTMSKMGISTMESYCGAQIFECVGLDRDLVERHFTGTPSRLGGVGLPTLDLEARTRHERGFGPGSELAGHLLPRSGQYRWRRQGERHVWTPTTVPLLQHAVRTADRAAWDEYTALVAERRDAPLVLRDLLEPVPDGDTVPLDEVEPVESLVRRFCTGAMSFGSISAPAHESLARAMNALGGKSNTGEGGEEAARLVDERRSAIKQVASGRFGVHATYLVNADELQIKIAQGAKPGEGGQLPGHKVTERIAAVRCSTPGVTLISPPPHHDIYSIEDLAQLVYDLNTVNPAARVSVKLVSEVGVGTVAAGVAKAGAGAVVIAGSAGGTGASPLTGIQHAGLPWELGLAETQQVLVDNGLRDRIRVQVDGGLRTARDVMVATLLGAEEFGFATAPLISLGCILLRRCHQNTCSVGVATQDPELIERFTGDPEHVIRFFRFLAEDLRVLLASLGFRSLDEAVGRVDRLRHRLDIGHEKARTLDLSAILTPPRRAGAAIRHHHTPPVDRATHMDVALIEDARAALDGGPAIHLDRRIQNTDRAVGALLSGTIAKQHGPGGLPAAQIDVAFEGSAGQSFGAFLMPGVRFTLRGDANDYLGKGLSGGVIAVRPPEGSHFVPEDNVIIGNTVLYGATSGAAYICGQAGERFAVRNSGAVAVVEGVGDHGCEYMTGGVVLCIGRTGRNFAAGMSGGIAYVHDPDGTFALRVNPGMVELGSLVESEDLRAVLDLLAAHHEHTGSALAQRLLDNWEVAVPEFVKVLPTEYKRVLQLRRSRRIAADAETRGVTNG